MNGSLSTLLIGASILIFLILLFLPEKGILAQWKKANGNRDRVLIEDALKYLFDNQYKSLASSWQSIAGALHITQDKATELITRLEGLRLINASDKNDIRLTDEGRSYALRVIRIHRIWERYLADETDIEEKDWHPEADIREHKMSLGEANRLASRIGNPVIDPHGDPIPSSSGKIPDYAGKPMNELTPGTLARIVHIEDEPKTIYQQLLAMGLFPGMEIRIIDNSMDKICFEFKGEELILAPIFAANITVKEKSPAQTGPAYTLTLDSIERGKKARVLGISPECRKQQKRRLMDLGIVPGTEIEVFLESAGKNPRAYRILNTLIALRNRHAALIFVEPA